MPTYTQTETLFFLSLPLSSLRSAYYLVLPATGHTSGVHDHAAIEELTEKGRLLALRDSHLETKNTETGRQTDRQTDIQSVSQTKHIHKMTLKL
jgi:hypothetical protein